MKYVSSREFNREPSRVKRAAASEDVIVTERGKPTLAVISYEQYSRMKAEKGESLLDLARSLPETPDSTEVDECFEAAMRRDQIHRPFEFD